MSMKPAYPLPGPSRRKLKVSSYPQVTQLNVNNVFVGKNISGVDKNAPRKPLTAFMLFMKARRSSSEYVASLPFKERNRLLGAEWSELPKDEKQAYCSKAAEEREKYKVLLAEYKSTDAYKAWLASSDNHVKKSKGKRGLARESEPNPYESNFKVSIFTGDFLQYNRLREVVLRQLKKQVRIILLLLFRYITVMECITNLYRYDTKITLD
ncbi:unnamed protein product [Echinostoma caproni]|uniref:HMG box domain-containing protein n=1 Tax=Echinostoma caproni TaxID=27848 RepID=A0A183BDG3_9TREM|nr:unnamed protein product [Echinostoma caproni]